MGVIVAGMKSTAGLCCQCTLCQRSQYCIPGSWKDEGWWGYQIWFCSGQLSHWGMTRWFDYKMVDSWRGVFFFRLVASCSQMLFQIIIDYAMITWSCVRMHQWVANLCWSCSNHATCLLLNTVRVYLVTRVRGMLQEESSLFVFCGIVAWFSSCCAV